MTHARVGDAATTGRVTGRAREIDRSRATQWLLVAVGSLLVAGILALLLVVGRTPPLSFVLTDPQFFKRCLVVHVDLALVLWFYAFVAALFSLIPSRVAPNPIGRHSAWLAAVGLGIVTAAAGIPGVRPVLANYVPVLDHPVYLTGLLVIATAVVATILDGRLLPRNEVAEGAVVLPVSTVTALRASAIAILLALLTFAGAALVVPDGLAAEAHYEALMWGGGHVLQFASVAAMLGVWSYLLTPVMGREPVSRGAAAALLAALVTPLFAAPALALSGTSGATYRVGMTRLMQFGIAPVVLIFLALSVGSVARARKSRAERRALLGDGRFVGFLASATLTVAGFALGAAIRGPNTVVPGHYHASIGGVTVAFMAATYPLLEGLGFRLPAGALGRLSRVQPALLGAGQLVFAIGFGLAGAHGMRRKAYGQEQEIRSLAEYVGLGVMGAGGIVAVAGGILFLGIVAAALRHRAAVGDSHKRGHTWRAATNTPFNG